MAYDEALAQRIRELLSDEVGVTEMRMFGGLAFLIGGNMAVAASGEGGILLRVDPADTGRLLEEPGAEECIMRGRSMQGWLRVPTDALKTKSQLATWAKIGVAYAKSLPAKVGAA